MEWGKYPTSFLHVAIKLSQQPCYFVCFAQLSYIQSFTKYILNTYYLQDSDIISGYIILWSLHNIQSKNVRINEKRKFYHDFSNIIFGPLSTLVRKISPPALSFNLWWLIWLHNHSAALMIFWKEWFWVLTLPSWESRERWSSRDLNWMEW